MAAGTSPAMNTVTAPLAGSALTIGFSEALTPASAAGIRVFSAQAGGLKAGTIAASGSTASYTSSLGATLRDFRPGETVSVTVPATVQSANGLAAQPYVYQFTTATTAGPGTFGTRTDYATGTYAASPVLGDVNGDGQLDVVTAASYNSNNVSVLLGQGGGTFGGRADYAVGTYPCSVALGDANGDGQLDLVAANAPSSTVSVLLGQGGALGGRVDYAVGAGPDGVALGDVNGDGRLDVATANGPGSVSVLLGLPALPTITAIAPASGAPGTVVTLTGTNLAGVSGVRFGGGGLAPAFTVVNATTLTAVVPLMAATGAVTVTVPAVSPNTASSSGTGAGLFTVVPRTPVSVRLTPAAPLPACTAQTLTAAAVNPAFDLGGTGLDYLVYALAAQPDGKILVGGAFTSYNGSAAPRYLLRLNADGSLDPAFNPGGAGFNDLVTTVVVQPDGKVLVGGSFTSYNGNAAAPDGLVRLNANGTLDTSFNPARAGFDNYVNALALLPDGRVLVGGSFTRYNGNNNVPDGLLRLTSAGAWDATFNPNGTGFGNAVNTLAVQADGRVLAGGGFSTYNGATVPARLVRLSPNGSLDATFISGGFDGDVYALAVQADNKILAGGIFGYNGTTATPFGLARLNADGTPDAAYNAGGLGFDDGVMALALQADGQALVGGFFTAYNGTPRAGLLRLGSTGALDNTFNPGGSGLSSYALAVAPQADGQVLVGGDFADYNGSPAPDRLLRLSATGSLNGSDVALTGATYAFSPVAGSGNTITTSTAGSYSATATVGGTTSAPSNVAVIAPCPLPFLSSLSPTIGPVGTVVVLTGTNLGNATSVSFNGVTTTGISNNTATNLTVSVPMGATTGNVRVTTPGGTSNGVNYTVVDDLIIVVQRTVPPGLYRNITVTSTGNGTLLPGVSVYGNFVVQSGGILNTACQPLTGPGNFRLEAGGTLNICEADGIAATAATGAVQVTGSRTFSPAADYGYVGSTAQTTGDGLPATVRSLTLNNATGLALAQPLAVSQALTLPQGVLATGTSAITLAPAATIAETTGGYVTGTVQTTRTLATAGTTETFGGLGLSLTPNGSTLPGSTLVRRVTGTPLTVGNRGIGRYFDIVPTVDNGLRVDMVFGYRDNELNGVAEAQLAMFKSENGTAGPWLRQSPVVLDAAATTVSKASISSFSTWTLAGASAPLPVELLDFTARLAGPSAVRLAWTTASEKNSAAFEVERSLDGTTFGRIGTVAAAGSSTTARSYGFEDPLTLLPAYPPTLYYRLRQVDLDGTATYAPVRSVTLPAKAGLALFPNPAHAGAATLAGTAPGMVVRVYDAVGRTVAQATADAAGTAALALPVGLAAGVYVVRAGSQALRLMVE